MKRVLIGILEGAFLLACMAGLVLLALVISTEQQLRAAGL